MPSHIASISLLVRDYDEAIAFFTTALKFELTEDRPMEGKRFVTVAPRGSMAGGGPSLVLARASTPEQLARIGDQTGGRVFLFLHTDDFDRDYAHMRSHGVRFLEAPRPEAYGTVAVFLDLYGNKWDLLQRVSDVST